MPAKSNTVQSVKPKRTTTDRDVHSVLDLLTSHATKATRNAMARYGIPSDNALGVPVGKIRLVAKGLGRQHELAEALWQTGVYEARMLTSFVDDPKLVTPGQMDRWARDFDSWAICDTVCFHLFDRTPHAWSKIRQWSNKREEFVKRAAFALLASVALHDKAMKDEPFLTSLPLIEQAADDERNFVKKGVSWALRGVGRRNAALHAAAFAMAERLATAPSSSARWIGRDAMRDLNKPAVLRRIAKRLSTSATS